MVTIIFMITANPDNEGNINKVTAAERNLLSAAVVYI